MRKAGALGCTQNLPESGRNACFLGDSDQIIDTSDAGVTSLKPQDSAPECDAEMSWPGPNLPELTEMLCVWGQRCVKQIDWRAWPCANLQRICGQMPCDWAPFRVVACRSGTALLGPYDRGSALHRDGLRRMVCVKTLICAPTEPYL